MIHHISLGVTDINRSSRFYTAVLQPLAYRVVCSGRAFVGYGVKDGVDPFYIVQRDGAHQGGPGCHLAFVAPSRMAVDKFHAEGTSRGGLDNGQPGIRASYGPGYYAAFLIDPDGHRLEAVHQELGA